MIAKPEVAFQQYPLKWNEFTANYIYRIFFSLTGLWKLCFKSSQNINIQHKILRECQKFKSIKRLYNVKMLLLGSSSVIKDWLQIFVL